MAWDDDSFESDFDNDPEGYADFHDDWQTGHDWNEDREESGGEVTDTGEHYLDRVATGSVDGWGDDGGSDDDPDDPWAAPYGPKAPPDDMGADEFHDAVHAMSSEWMDGGRDEWGEPLYAPDEWEGEPASEELVPGLEEFSDDDRAQLLDNVLDNEEASWFNRLRRKTAFKVGLDWKMPGLGYMIDYDRDRHAGMDFATEDAGDEADDFDDPPPVYDGGEDGYQVWADGTASSPEGGFGTEDSILDDFGYGDEVHPDDAGDAGGTGSEDLIAMQEELVEMQLDNATESGGSDSLEHPEDTEAQRMDDEDEHRHDTGPGTK